MKKTDQLLMLLSSQNTKRADTHSEESTEHALPACMIGGKEEAILLINTLVNAKNTGSVDQLYTSQSSMSSM